MASMSVRIAIGVTLVLATCGGRPDAADDVVDAERSCAELRAQFVAILETLDQTCTTDADCTSIGGTDTCDCAAVVSGDYCDGYPIRRGADADREQELGLLAIAYRHQGCAQAEDEPRWCDCRPQPVHCDGHCYVHRFPPEESCFPPPPDAAIDADLTVPDASPL